MAYNYNSHSLRVKRSKLAHSLQGVVIKSLAVLTLLLLLVATYLLITGISIGYTLLGLSVPILMVVIWHSWSLSHLEPANVEEGQAELDQLLPTSITATVDWPTTPKKLWDSLSALWQARFFTQHLAIHPDAIGPLLSDNPADLDAVWEEAFTIARETESTQLNEAIIAAALLTTNPEANTYLSSIKLGRTDLLNVVSWYTRLEVLLIGSKQRLSLGGIGRDWAYGYTPILDRYGLNLSQLVSHGSYYFDWLAHSEMANQAISQLGRGSGGNVALVGEAGTGKTSLAYALAKRMLAADEVGPLAYHQVVSLDASQLISLGGGPGELENIILTLLSEASHAGNIILFLDEAQLFFGHGTGAVDLSKILLPVLGQSPVKFITAFSPTDWEHLRSTNPSLVALLNRVNVGETDKGSLLQVIQDRALSLEGGSGKLITYQAVTEAYRLADRYLQDEAFPGKAVRLLEDSVSSSADQMITEATLQQVVEGRFGVKVAPAGGEEAASLLDLDTKIHSRMVNQTRAVDAVSAALQRARAGVNTPKRPVGSFLFLGPTGVGKTELAKSLAWAYFGSEQQLVRLDMSEYQNPEDVERILAGGTDQSSLLLAVSKQPFSVVLLDEIEKAHPSVLNLLLQLLDEGRLTDQSGKAVSFRDCIIIATSNAGADEIRRHIEAGEDLSSFEEAFVNKLIESHLFLPELLNRFDEIVLFRPLKEEELLQVASLMVAEVNLNLANQNVRVELTGAALSYLVEQGHDPRLGARPMRRVVQRLVENAVAQKLLAGTVKPGETLRLDRPELESEVTKNANASN
jgi:ATP-dependent Clp protease ATP-binding subunit ClpC